MKFFSLLTAVALTTVAHPVAGQADSVSTPPAVTEAAKSVPFEVGEKATYEVHFGRIRVGSGSMEVLDIVSLRGYDAWHTRFRAKGGIPLARVDDLMESWFDTTSMASLRFVQDLREIGRERKRHYEIFPERGVYKEGDKPEQPTVQQPLDDGSFLYFVRTIPLEVGQTYTFERYFRPDRNPVIIKVLGREKIKVPAGTFNAVVIQPIIKTSAMFGEGGEARIWLSDDDERIMLQLKTKLKIGSLNLYLTSFTPGKTATR